MRRSKYGAVPTTVDGVTFHSKKEARRYVELKMLEKAGEITGLILQPEFPLAPWMSDHSDVRIIGKYRGDFAYDTKSGEGIVEDVKGFKTPLYKWKKKHVEAQYGIEVREI